MKKLIVLVAVFATLASLTPRAIRRVKAGLREASDQYYNSAENPAA